MAKSSFHHYVGEVIVTLTSVFKRAPHLPKSIIDMIIRISPPLALIFGALFVLYGLGELGEYPVNSVIIIIWGVFLLLAFSPLRSRKYPGWKYLFYADCVMVLAGLISLSIGGLLVTAIMAVLAFYLLFETKAYYS